MNKFVSSGRAILRTLLPRRVYDTLKRLPNEATKPKSNLHRQIGRLASGWLNPVQYQRLRKTYMKFVNRKGKIEQLATAKQMPKINIQKILSGGKEFSSVEDFLSAQNGQIECATVICCAFLGRHEILDMVVGEGSRQIGEDKTVFCLVGSSDEDREYLKLLTKNNPNVIGAITVNKPVGLKWQASVQLAREMCDFEILAITGSDDILPGHLIKYVVSRHRINVSNTNQTKMLPALYATNEWAILSIGEKQSPVPQMVRCNYTLEDCAMPLGAGRFYTREFVDERVNGLLFDVNRQNLLDNLGFELVTDQGLGIEYFDIEQGCVCSIKGDWAQMNDWKKIVSAPNIAMMEFSFQGYKMLKNQLSQETMARLFKPLTKSL